MDDDGLLYRVYEKRLSRELANYQLPQHLGVIVDGNRRWARAAGITTAEGHRQGGARITEFLTWCEDLGIPLVTVWLLSTDNMNRSAEELDDLVEIIAETVEQIADAGFPVRLAGNMGDIPAVTRERIRRVEQRALLEGSGSRAARAAKSSVNSAAKSPVKVSAKGQARGGKTADEARDLTVNVAIGYGGREEIVEASRELVRDLVASGTDPEKIAEAITAESIAAHLYTRGQPDPDLIIRTSGEQRLSGFLLWQSVHSEFWFCDTNWPDFRRVDLLRALRDFCHRERRYGA
jgi:short-chain Z-isoprenyl diphosphate synthase